jgi:class 3 adenylate cyclase
VRGSVQTGPLAAVILSVVDGARRGNDRRCPHAFSNAGPVGPTYLFCLQLRALPHAIRSVTRALLYELPGRTAVTLLPVVPVQTTRATVLFADMRGYTGLAEQLPPAQVVPLLDEFFGVLAGATEAYGGEVFHMAGDGMMAGFGVRDPDQHGAGQALAAGRAMLRRFSHVAKRWQRECSIATGIGVGLHLGEVALGLLGPAGKRTLTLVGDTPNVAARLCGRARNGEVLFSSAVAAALDAGADLGPAIGRAAFLLLPQFALRGRNGLLDIWCVPAAERPVL